MSVLDDQDSFRDHVSEAGSTDVKRGTRYEMPDKVVQRFISLMVESSDEDLNLKREDSARFARTLSRIESILAEEHLTLGDGSSISVTRLRHKWRNWENKARKCIAQAIESDVQPPEMPSFFTRFPKLWKFFWSKRSYYPKREGNRKRALPRSPDASEESPCILTDDMYYPVVEEKRRRSRAHEDIAPSQRSTAPMSCLNFADAAPLARAYPDETMRATAFKVLKKCKLNWKDESLLSMTNKLLGILTHQKWMLVAMQLSTLEQDTQKGSDEWDDEQLQTFVKETLFLINDVEIE